MRNQDEFVLTTGDDNQSVIAAQLTTNTYLIINDTRIGIHSINHTEPGVYDEEKGHYLDYFTNDDNTEEDISPENFQISTMGDEIIISINSENTLRVATRKILLTDSQRNLKTLSFS